MNVRIYRNIIFALMLVYSASCQKNNQSNSNIPNVSFDISLHTNEPQFFDLQIIGGWEYADGGSRGLIIYRKDFDNFIAYDRHTPYEPNNACAVVDVDSSNIVAVDRCSESEFSLINGSVVKGPAVRPLKQYRTDYDGTILRVYN